MLSLCLWLAGARGPEAVCRALLTASGRSTHDREQECSDLGCLGKRWERVIFRIVHLLFFADIYIRFRRVYFEPCRLDEKTIIEEGLVCCAYRSFFHFMNTTIRSLLSAFSKDGGISRVPF